MDKPIDEAERFKNAIAPFLPTWQSIELKGIVDLREGQVLSLVGCLSPEQPKTFEEIEPIIQDILFIKGAVPANQLNSLVDGWIQGVIQLGTRAFETTSFSAKRFQELSSPWPDIASIWPEFSTYRQFLLYAHGPGIQEMTKPPRDIEGVARAWGFRSFEELSFHRVQFRVGSGYVTRMQFFAPLLANMEIRLCETELQMVTRVHHAMLVDDLAVSYRVEDSKGDRIAGDRVSLSGFATGSAGYFTSLEGTVTIPQGARSGEAHLYHPHCRWGAEPIATKLFAAPPVAGETNSRWDLIMSIARNTRKWTKLGAEPEDAIKKWLGLGTSRPEETDLIQGVACLMFASGLIVLSIPGAEGVDQVVMASEPTKVAIALSYTTSPDVGDKVSNLVLQVNRLKDTLKGYAVHAVILTPVEQKDLRVGDVEECKAKEINLVLRPDLETMLQLATGGEQMRAAEMLIQILTRRGFGLI